MNSHSRRSRARGFTLIEVMIAMAVLAVTILGVLMMLMAAEALSEDSKNLTTAVEDARSIMERVRKDVETNADMSTFVTNYPDSSYEDWVTDQQAAGTEFVNLDGEAVDVTLGNVGDDPLDVTVTVSWNDRGGRVRSTTLQTQITNRG